MYTSSARSGGIAARSTFAARVARNDTVVSVSSTMNTSGVPSGSVSAMRAAVVARSTSSGEMNGNCRLQAIRAPDAISPTSATATSVASQARRSNQSQTATTPTPASAGIENPNVISRSAGNQPVSNPTGAPSTTSAVHAASTRRANPLVRISPSAASGNASHCTYRVQRWSVRSR